MPDQPETEPTSVDDCWAEVAALARRVRKLERLVSGQKADPALAMLAAMQTQQQTRLPREVPRGARVPFPDETP